MTTHMAVTSRTSWWAGGVISQ